MRFPRDSTAFFLVVNSTDKMVKTGHSFAATDNVVYRLLALNAAGKKTKIQRLSAINQSPVWDYLAERRQRLPRRD